MTNACYKSLFVGGGSIIAITRLASLISADVHRQIITCISPDDSEGGSLLNYNRLNEQTM